MTLPQVISVSLLQAVWNQLSLLPVSLSWAPECQTLDCRQWMDYSVRLQIALKEDQGTQLQFTLIFLKKTPQNNKTNPLLQYEKPKKTVNFDLKAAKG